jgi:hypothetical protein
LSPEDAKKLQALLDSKNNTGVNLDLDPETGKIKWGCPYCAAALVLLTDKCVGNSYFPGIKCLFNKEKPK